MFTHILSKALLASVAAGLVTFAVAPASAEIGAPRSVAVSYTDLDMSSGVGKAQLKKRIAYAAETVCGAVDHLSYHSVKSNSACQERAIANASRVMVEVFADAGSTIRVSAN